MRSTTSGFTLIEMMITVAIIGILAAVALPKYEQYLRRTQYVEIKEAAMSGKAAVESCIQLKSDRALCIQATELAKHGFVAASAATSALVDNIAVAAHGADIAITVTPANNPAGASFLSAADTYVLRARIGERNAADLYVEQWIVDDSSGCAPKQWC